MRSHGFNDDDISNVINADPSTLIYTEKNLLLKLQFFYSIGFTEKKLRAVMEFLVDKMGVQVEAIVKCPYVLSLSLEERIIPRCSVIYVLVQKGLLDQKDWKLSSVAFPSQKDFLNRFVNKNQDIALHLLKVYEGEVDPFKDYSAPIAEMEKP